LSETAAPRRVPQRVVEAFVGLTAIAGVLWILRDLIAAHLWSKEAKVELIQVFHAIPDRATPDEVELVLRRGRYNQLSVVKLGDEWILDTPYMFGARNWRIWVEFESGRVNSLRVRTMDSRDEHPDGAPADRVYSAEPSSNSAYLDSSA
jgi:hypothetical protein